MQNMADTILKNLFLEIPKLEVCKNDILRAFEILCDSFSQGGKLLVCGNGGSASDSEHIVGELMKGFCRKRPADPMFVETLRNKFPNDWQYLTDSLQGALPAISLVSQSALITACINDLSGDMMFAQQVYAYGRKGDTLMVLSTSGQSKNVLNAAKVAIGMGIPVIGITGEDGGSLTALCEVTIRVPAAGYKAQELHLPIYHALCRMLEQNFFPE